MGVAGGIIHRHRGVSRGRELPARTHREAGTLIESCGIVRGRNDDGVLDHHVVDPGGVDGPDRLVAVDFTDDAEPAVGEQLAGGIAGRARIGGQRMRAA